jgi:adenosylcobinamide kinase/adenosylcobinamide-phosphate guanylyltransferase
VLLNTGNGKGKSSAAFGVMVRGARDRDWKVAVVQFIKGGDWKVGEEKIGRQLGVEWHALGGGFTWDSDDQSADIALARAAWDQAAAIIAAGEHDLVILDEVTYLCTWGWVPVEEVVAAIAGRPRHVNVVMTGPRRGAGTDRRRRHGHRDARGQARLQGGHHRQAGHRLLMPLTFLLGGARSGKSTLAVQMGEHHGGPVHFIATAQAFDDDLRERIARHRAERPVGWSTAEVPLDLAAAVADSPAGAFVIVDCLTVWLGNLFVHTDDTGRAAASAAFVAALRDRAVHGTAPTVVVSNEVGMGVHPETTMGRDYRDELGRLNQAVAAAADRSLLLVAGRALRLDNPWELLR